MSTATTVPAGTYGLDSVHSSIGFAVKYNGIAAFRSTFETYDAALTDGVLTGTADVASIAIDEPNFKGHLQGEDFFNAAAADDHVQVHRHQGLRRRHRRGHR